MISELSIHDSGVRRFTRSASTRLKRLLPYVVPMAPKRKPAESEEPAVDKSIVAWRGFMTVMTSVLVYLGMGSPNAPHGNNQAINDTLARFDKRLAAIEDRRERDMERIEGKFDTFIKTINEYRPSARK